MKTLNSIIYFLISFIVGLLIIGNCYAGQNNGYGSVLDNNEGSKGQILVNTGESNGNSDVGEWTNPSEVSELKGEKGEKGVSGQDGIDGQKGEKGDRGLQGIQGLPGVGIKDRYEAILEGRIKDTKKTTWSIVLGRDFNNDNNIYAIKCVIKFGESYEERKIRKLEEQIEELKTIIKGE